MRKAILFVFALIFIALLIARASADVCYCDSCSNCTDALNNASCTEVRLTANITVYSATCINNPSGFNNKVFDCQGHTINGNFFPATRGIYLDSKQNNTIKNCIITDFDDGILLVYSSNNTLINNTLDNDDGIYLVFSSNNTLINNTARLNSEGIYFYSSNNNILINNNASSNGDGILLSSSSNNTLINNTVSSNSDGIFLSSSSNNTLINNTVSSNNYHGIYLSYSSNNTLINNNVVNSNNYHGIYLSYSSNNNILTNNTVSSNRYGIYLRNSSNNTLINNNVSSNINGIYLVEGSSNNNIYNNFFNNTNNFYFAGTISANNWNTTKTPGINIVGGFYLGGNFWAKPDGTGFSETCADNDWDGICDEDYNLTTDNVDYLPLTYPPSLCSCSSCENCIERLNHLNPICSEVRLTANITDYSGTCIDNPENFNNKVFDCQGHIIDGDNSGTGYGIYLDSKQNNTIKNCIITDFENGIILAYSSNNTLINNTVSSNGDAGIYSYSSSNNTIANNTVSSNDAGIYLEGSSNNTLINNNVSSNINGIILVEGSSNNTLASNTISSNDEYGIILEDSSNNNIANNNFSNNQQIYSDALNFFYENLITGDNLELITNNMIIHSNIFLITNDLKFSTNDSLLYNNIFKAKNIVDNSYESSFNTTLQDGNRIAGLKGYITKIGGNYWTNWNDDGYSDICSDSDFDGFCDTPYTKNNIVDYLPLTGQIYILDTSYSYETLEGSKENYEIEFIAKNLKDVYFNYKTNKAKVTNKTIETYQEDDINYSRVKAYYTQVILPVEGEALYELTNYTWEIQQKDRVSFKNYQQLVHKMAISTTKNENFTYLIYQLDLKDKITKDNVTANISAIIELYPVYGNFKREYTFNITNSTLNLYAHFIRPTEVDEKIFYLKTKVSKIENSSYYTEADYICMPTDSQIFGKNTFYLLYGSDKIYAQNPDDVFIFFDDFNDNSLDESKWEVINNASGNYSFENGELIIKSDGDWWTNNDTSLYVLNRNPITTESFVAEVRMKAVLQNYQRAAGLRSKKDQNSTMYVLNERQSSSPYKAARVMRTTENGNAVESAIDQVLSSNVYYKLKFIVEKKNKTSLYINNVLKNTETHANFNFSYVALTDTHGTSGYNFFDYVYVMPYYDRSAVVTLGAERFVLNERKRDLIVTNPYPHPIENFTFSFTINTRDLIQAGKVNANCSNIHLQDANGNELSFWIEEDTCNTTETRIFVKIPELGTGVPYQRTLYIYPTNQSLTKVFFNIKDKNQRNYKDAYITIEELTPQGYFLVGSRKADVYGSTNKYVFEDLKHRINITDPSKCEFSHSKELLLQCKEIPCVFDVIASPTDKFVETIKDYNFKYSFNYDKENKKAIFYYDASEINGGFNSIKFYITHKNILNETLVCERNSISVIDQFECELNYSSEYDAWFEVKTNDGKIIKEKITLSDITNRFGVEGLIWSALVIIALFMVGIWNPVVAVGMSLVGVVMLSIFGFIILPYLAIITLVTIAVIMLIKLRT
ncbi:MAG: DUF2341 domain-containing protein [Candidatus Bathyarchaeia archaeon]